MLDELQSIVQGLKGVEQPKYQGELARATIDKMITMRPTQNDEPDTETDQQNNANDQQDGMAGSTASTFSTAPPSTEEAESNEIKANALKAGDAKAAALDTTLATIALQEALKGGYLSYAAQEAAKEKGIDVVAMSREVTEQIALDPAQIAINLDAIEHAKDQDIGRGILS